jgi:hypothetical protein
MIKQSRIQLSAVTRYNTNKSGELASPTTLAKVLGNVAFIQEVVVFIVPSCRVALLIASRIGTGDCGYSLSSISRGWLPEHKEKKKAHKHKS